MVQATRPWGQWPFSQVSELPTVKPYESPMEALNREKQAQREREEAARKFIQVRAPPEF